MQNFLINIFNGTNYLADGTEFWSSITNLAALVAVLSFVLGGLTFIVSKTVIPYIERRNECKETLENLYYEKFKDIDKYYVNSKYQDLNPADYDNDPKEQATRKDLLSFFKKSVFKENNSSRYYIVLAGSGMGKSTFLIKLYKDYMCSLFKLKRKQMKLIHLGAIEDYIDRIGFIEKKESTILLLDAFDEIPKINSEEDANTKLNELLGKVQPFYRVIITCRTQFFSSQNAEPNKMPFLSAKVRDKTVEIPLLYLSPFDEQDIKRYLEMKYRYHPNKQKKALEIIVKVPREDQIFIRPLVLSYIDDLIDSAEEMNADIDKADIYRIIIDAWLKREANLLIKDSSNKSIKDEEAKNRLMKFTVELTKFMYQNDNKQLVSLDEVEEIAGRTNINLNKLSVQGRSLLNRRADGGYKFAHKSFYDYMIAYLIMEKKLKENPKMNDFDINRFKMSKLSLNFCSRMALKRYETVKFGQIELEDRNVPIEWIVLETNEKEETLLLSKYILFYKEYNEGRNDCTWDECSLRTYLNEEFYQKCFSEEEKSRIKTNTIKNWDNAKYHTNGGKDTEDRIFLLGIEEANNPEYFEQDVERIAIHLNSDQVWFYWLRSPGDRSYYAASVFWNGYVLERGSCVDGDNLGVRPALWFQISNL